MGVRKLMRRWLIDIRGKQSQAQIAKIIGISQQMYSAIENDVRRPSPELAKTIADVMQFEKHNMSWTKFYEDKENSA
jgi:DNA-binding XRE family transcriptional regulator